MICPRCGLRFTTKLFTKSLQDIYTNFDEKTQISIKNILAEMIKVYGPEFANSKAIYDFLSEIKDINPKFIRDQIDTFYNKNLYTSKGLKYLSTMIKNIQSVKEAERKIFGRKPKVVIINENSS